jgi:hypothetical protein
MRRGNDAFMLMDAMSEPVQSRSRPQFDRPLRRMVWLVPASLCLWILILAGFALLLGNPVGGPSAPPLEVSLTDLGHGAPGGSPGGGPGTQGSGGGLGIKPIGASLPAAQSAAPRAVAPSGKHPVMTLSRPPVTFAVKPRRKRLPKPPMRIDEDAFARFRPPARTAAEKQVDADETAAWLQRRAHEPAAVPLTPLSAATQAKPAARTGSAIASLGGADAAPASGSGGGGAAAARALATAAAVKVQAPGAASAMVRKPSQRWNILPFQSPGFCRCIQALRGRRGWRARSCCARLSISAVRLSATSWWSSRFPYWIRLLSRPCGNGASNRVATPAIVPYES